MTNIELGNKVKEIRELTRMREELEAEITALQDEIKKQMEAEATYEYAGVDFKVSWKEVSSTRLDTTALKKALPELAEKFSKTTTSRRFCIA